MCGGEGQKVGGLIEANPEVPMHEANVQIGKEEKDIVTYVRQAGEAKKLRRRGSNLRFYGRIGKDASGLQCPNAPGGSSRPPLLRSSRSSSASDSVPSSNHMIQVVLQKKIQKQEKVIKSLTKTRKTTKSMLMKMAELLKCIANKDEVEPARLASLTEEMAPHAVDDEDDVEDEDENISVHAMEEGDEIDSRLSESMEHLNLGYQRQYAIDASASFANNAEVDHFFSANPAQNVFRTTPGLSNCGAVQPGPPAGLLPQSFHEATALGSKKNKGKEKIATRKSLRRS